MCATVSWGAHESFIHPIFVLKNGCDSKDAQPLQSVKTVITAVLTVTSGSENSQNKWLLDMWMTYDDDDEIIMMINLSS
jgi:hypothetical protein